MSIDVLVRDIVEQALAERVQPQIVEFISIDEAAKTCQCDRSVIDSLVQDAQNNGFPAIRLSRRITKIDKQRFFNWLRSGGLNGINYENR